MKALIITGKYVTDCEYTYALYRLQEAGYEVDVATIKGEPCQGILGEKVVPTMSIPNDPNPPKITIMGKTKFKDWKILIIPGGAKAMEYLRQDKDVLDAIRYLYEKGATVGSICHGAQLLISAGLVKDRKISGYYSIKDDINNAGGVFVDAPFVTDGRIITSPHYRYLGQWMKEVLRITLENHLGVGKGLYGIQ